VEALSRTFIGLVPPEDVRVALVRAAHEALGAAGEWRLYPEQDLHLTLAFLGPIDVEALERVKSALEQICVGPCDAHVTRCGAFPARGRERILWAGLDASDDLRALYRAAMDAARRAGCEPADADRAVWTPHITLARAREPRVVVPASFYDLALDLAWTAREIAVCQSDVRPGAALRYPVVHAVALPA
jgi:2'-5' RNA ligase